MSFTIHGLCGMQMEHCKCEKLQDGTLVQHVDSPRCWCKPTFDFEGDDGHCHYSHNYGLSETTANTDEGKR